MQPDHRMGHVSSEKRDLSRHETIWEHPDASQLLAPSRRTIAAIEGGSSLEAMAGLAAIVISVIGIAGYDPVTMGAVAVIAIGLALVAQGGAIAARWRDALRRLDGTRYDRNELLGGIGTEVFGGIVGIVLGILVLAGIAPVVLLPVAAIVFGGALLLGGAAQPELSAIAGPANRTSIQEAVEASGGIMVLVGIGAAVLGILALLEVGPPLTLAIVGLLCVGGALFFAGGTLAARFMRRFA